MSEVYSVSQINTYIKNMFLMDNVLNYISVRGEVSNCKYHTSGHIYFTLKDAAGQLACVMFASMRRGLPFRLEEGQSVVIRGKISIYERDGKYQLYANEIALDGRGDLFLAFELLKKKLSEEGLFDAAHKRPVPRFPKSVGVVTASTGAAIQDIINISHRRNPYVQLILYPAKVQGDGAARTVVNGIRALERLGVDTIIVGRGGGSIEDLWAFNEESVARAIYECGTPVISAVGHETDFTIADFVSDLRAPTPSAAAELAVGDISAVFGALVDAHSELYQVMLRRIGQYRQSMNSLAMQLKYTNPVYQLEQKKQRLTDLSGRLTLLFKQRLALKRRELMVTAERMKGLSPLEKLTSGYSYLADEEGHMVNSIGQTAPGRELNISVTDGEIRAQVLTLKKISRNDKR